MTEQTTSPADSKPLVSVCIPCHNAEAHLWDTLESVSQQTYGNIEVIAVCDRSSDRTTEILRAASERSRLKWVNSDLGSAAKSRNLAFSLSEGEFIKYLDADDLISPNLVALQVARLKQAENCIASARWKRFHESIDEREFAPDSTWADRDSIDWLVESFREGGIHSMMQCGMFLIPRRMIEIAGGWDERLTLIDDTEFFCRLFCNADRILHTDGALYYRSGMAGSLSGQKTRRAYESAVHAIEGFCRHLTTRELSSRTRQVAADLCQTYYYEIAPFESDLGAQLSSLAKSYGGSAVQPVGGPLFQRISRVIGWNAATRFRSLAQRVGFVAARRRFAPSTRQAPSRSGKSD